MSIIRYKDPFLDSSFSLINPLLEQIFDARNTNAVKAWYPPVDIKENANKIQLFIDLPGVDLKDINIEIDESNRALIISGHRVLREKEDKENYIRIERWESEFYRSFPLPEITDLQNISAHTDNKGVIIIDIPKKERPKPQKVKINVQSQLKNGKENASKQ